MESIGYKPLTSLGLYCGPQQHSGLHLGAHVSGHDPAQVCAEAGGTGVDIALEGVGKGFGGSTLGGGEQQIGVH